MSTTKKILLIKGFFILVNKSFLIFYKSYLITQLIYGLLCSLSKALFKFSINVIFYLASLVVVDLINYISNFFILFEFSVFILLFSYVIRVLLIIIIYFPIVVRFYGLDRIIINIIFIICNFNYYVLYWVLKIFTCPFISFYYMLFIVILQCLIFMFNDIYLFLWCEKILFHPFLINIWEPISNFWEKCLLYKTSYCESVYFEHPYEFTYSEKAEQAGMSISEWLLINKSNAHLHPPLWATHDFSFSEGFVHHIEKSFQDVLNNWYAYPDFFDPLYTNNITIKDIYIRASHGFGADNIRYDSFVDIYNRLCLDIFENLRKFSLSYNGDDPIVQAFSREIISCTRVDQADRIVIGSYDADFNIESRVLDNLQAHNTFYPPYTRTYLGQPSFPNIVTTTGQKIFFTSEINMLRYSDMPIHFNIPAGFSEAEVLLIYNTTQEEYENAIQQIRAMQANTPITISDDSPLFITDDSSEVEMEDAESITSVSEVEMEDAQSNSSESEVEMEDAQSSSSESEVEMEHVHHDTPGAMMEHVDYDSPGGAMEHVDYDSPGGVMEDVHYDSPVVAQETVQEPVQYVQENGQVIVPDDVQQQNRVSVLDYISLSSAFSPENNTALETGNTGHNYNSGNGNNFEVNPLEISSSENSSPRVLPSNNEGIEDNSLTVRPSGNMRELIDRIGYGQNINIPSDSSSSSSSNMDNDGKSINSNSSNNINDDVD